MNALQFWRSFLNVEKYRTNDEATKHFLCLHQINHLKWTDYDMYHLLTYFKQSTSSPIYLLYFQMSFGWQSKHFFPPMGQYPPLCQGPLTVEASRSHSDTPHSVGLLWTGEQPVAETSTWQYVTLIRERHPWPRRDSNPQSQQANGWRPTTINSY
jgi:hypothetical protein